MKCLLLLVTIVITTLNTLADPIPTACPSYDPVGSNATHLAHENDCTKFYKCSNGKKYEMNCPKSQRGQLFFNPKLQVCDWPWNVDSCTHDTTTTTASPTEAPTTTTAAPTEAPTTTTVAPTQAPTTVTASPTQAPTTTTAVPTQAPTTTTASPTQSPTTTTASSTQAPTTTTASPTQAPTTTTAAPTEAPAPSFCRPSKSDCTGVIGKCNVRHELDCYGYYSCQNGRKFFRCCGEGYAFNPIIGECDLKPNCTPSIGICH